MEPPEIEQPPRTPSLRVATAILSAIFTLCVLFALAIGDMGFLKFAAIIFSAATVLTFLSAIAIAERW